jgi:hypothetical protein
MLRKLAEPTHVHAWLYSSVFDVYKLFWIPRRTCERLCAVDLPIYAFLCVCTGSFASDGQGVV